MRKINDLLLLLLLLMEICQLIKSDVDKMGMDKVSLIIHKRLRLSRAYFTKGHYGCFMDRDVKNSPD